MQKRRFYRIDEFTDTTSPTKGDLLNAVDEGKLTYCALIDEKTMGALLGDNKPIRSTLGQLFGYKGLVGLTLRDSQALNLSESLSVSSCLVLEPEKVVDPRRFDNDFPKARVRLFEKVRPHEPISAKPFWAYPSIGEKGAWSDSYLEMAREFNKNGSFDLEAAQKAFFSPDKELEAKAIVIGQRQLMVDSKAIINMQNETKRLETESKTSKLKENVLPSINKYPLNEIVDRIFDAYPNAQSDQIWALLSEEVSSDSDERVFDVDFAIDEVDDDERIIYHVRRVSSQDPETTSYEPFKNLVSRRRKRRNTASS
ncbi:hypothetical protein [Grimontia sp. SpTr1]|uniref:hypothetical protein n=1 Tax=Grimontia sp. SpTr1 TaxID=2995319 RepID=UPI00248CF087|nr:hypothetical protein [Grimontia sp. SpTr1]